MHDAVQVVQGARSAKITLYNNQTFDAELKGLEPSKDLAVLKIVRRSPADFIPITVTSSSNLQVIRQHASQHASKACILASICSRPCRVDPCNRALSSG